MELRLHPGARLDIAEAHAWYLREGAEIAVGFREALEEAFTRLSAHPERWPLQKTGVRRFIVRRFPFSVFYTLETDVITIVAVAHQRRRPGWFAGRVRG